MSPGGAPRVRGEGQGRTGADSVRIPFRQHGVIPIFRLRASGPRKGERHMMNLGSRRSRAGMVLAAALVLAAGVAEARVGRGGSFGSRGGRTYEAPPMTRTAPAPASPIQRSQVPNTGPAVQ